MSSSPLPFDPEQSKADRVYNDLRRRIRELVLPPGAPLRKEEIALALGVSRAPVSEAIAPPPSLLADCGCCSIIPAPLTPHIENDWNRCSLPELERQGADRQILSVRLFQPATFGDAAIGATVTRNGNESVPMLPSQTTTTE